MATASRCIACRQRQLTALPALADFSHGGYCRECASDLARRSLRSLCYYDPGFADLLELLDDELHAQTASRRQERLQNLVYPDDQVVGILVAVSRLYAAEAVELHLEVLREEGAVAFGKFRYSRRSTVGGEATPRPLEALERERNEGPARGWFRERVQARLQSDRPLQLFILDPDPPAKLWMGRIRQAEIRSDRSGTPDFSPPRFDGHLAESIVPDYYWLDQGTKGYLRYHCDFWVLLDSLVELQPRVLRAMLDLETQAPITLATSQLYPAEVSVPEDHLRRVDDTPASPVRRRRRRVTIDLGKLAKHLSKVRLSRHALEDLQGSPQDMVDQVANALVQMERYGFEYSRYGRKFGGDDDLYEFDVTGPGRLAAAWAAGEWHVVGLSSKHPNHFYRQMKQVWRGLRDAPD